ncbi:MAG TPA: S-layer homology domain-containing protein [Chloroflexia bacterium]|nr:S-layer homology domain-containing protein [Chloroflexia bacterium]
MQYIARRAGLPILAAAVFGLFSPAQQESRGAVATTVPPVRFAIIGDYGTAGQPEADVAALVHSWNPDFVMTTGDNNYPNGGADTIDANIGQHYHDFIYPYAGIYGSGAPINQYFPAVGNHDWVTPGAQPYLDYFGLPGNERYYDMGAGAVRIFAVDSDPAEPDGITSASVQAGWLQTRLAATTEPWKLVYFHHPPYSSGVHGPTPDLQWPFQDWGASVVLSGHDHDYERIMLKDFPYIVNGIGGTSLYAFGKPVPGSVVRYNDDFGAMLATADQGTLRFDAVSRAGVAIDTYTMTRQLPTATVTPVPPSPTTTRTATATATQTASQTPTSTATQTLLPTNTPSRTPTGTAVPATPTVVAWTSTRTPVPSMTPQPATGTPTVISPSRTPAAPTATVPPAATATAVPTDTRPPSATTAPTRSTVVPTATIVLPSPSPCPLQFTDVPPGSAFYVYVRCLACQGIVSGYADGTYRPGAEVTRGQVSKMVTNAAGWADPVPGDQQTFADVGLGSTFWLYIERLAGRGYVSGYTCGFPPAGACDPQQRAYFLPYRSVTRGQLAKIVANSAGYAEPVASGRQTFSDVPGSHPFWIFVERIALHGVISGYTCGGPGENCDPQGRPYFRPYATATRGQGAKILAGVFFPGCQTFAIPALQALSHGPVTRGENLPDEHCVLGEP